MLEVFDLYRMDCPEHYWIDNMQIKYQGIGHIVTQINFKYNSTLDSRDSYDKQVASLVDQIKGQNIGAREYDKVKYVHDFIVTSTSYEESSIHNQDIISVLINKSSVCAGYAKATQYLLNELGIECLYVSGFSKGEAHAWNIVKVNDAYYNLDTTWDDPIITDSATAIDFEKYISYRYFLITDDQLKKTHEQVAPPSINIPTCNSTSMNYFVKEGLLYDQFDANTMNAIASKLSHDMLNGQRPQFLAFKFTNNQAYSFYMDQLASTWHQIATIVNEGLGNDLINPYSVSNLSSGGDEDIVEMIIYYR